MSSLNSFQFSKGLHAPFRNYFSHSSRKSSMDSIRNELFLECLHIFQRFSIAPRISSDIFLRSSEFLQEFQVFHGFHQISFQGLLQKLPTDSFRKSEVNQPRAKILINIAYDNLSEMFPGVSFEIFS